MTRYRYLLTLAAGLALLAAPAFGQRTQAQEQAQGRQFGGVVAAASPHGGLFYVDSVSGNNGNSALDPQHAVLTLTRALAMASAGDTIILNPGGSETVTATLAVSRAGLKITCPVENPDSGFTISGAGTIDLMTISAGNVKISGLKFAHTGATSSAAGILTTAAGDGLYVENCVFDDSAIVTNFTGFGIEITDDLIDLLVEGCRFKDCHRGVLFVTGSAKNAVDARIVDCVFWVGQATAFGVHSNPTGTLRGLTILNCVFIEADGDGTAATDAWDGTDGTNAASGPLLLGANVDQYLIANCRAYTALATSFDLIQAINAGAAGDLVGNETGAGGGAVSTLIGTINSTTTDNLHGKIGTDSEMGDRSIWDMLEGDGFVTWPSAAAPADNVSLAEGLRYVVETQIGTLVNAGGTATLGGILGDFANVDGVTRFGNIQTEVDKIGTIVNAGGTATIGGILGDFANSSAVTRFGNIQTEVDKLGTVVNAGGTATIGAILGDFANTTLIGHLGVDADGTATDNLHGKIGTDTEMNDNSLYDLIGAGAKTLALADALGSDADDTATDNLHGKIGTDTEMNDLSLFDMLTIGTATGEADIDISEDDYTTWITLMTITPNVANPVLVIDLDWNKATTGYDNVSTAADTLDVCIVGQVDGTNYRTLMNGTQIEANGNGTLEDHESGERFQIGPLSTAESVIVKVKLSIERGDCEIPYRVTYQGAAPTVTPVALP